MITNSNFKVKLTDFENSMHYLTFNLIIYIITWVFIGNAELIVTYLSTYIMMYVSRLGTDYLKNMYANLFVFLFLKTMRLNLRGFALVKVFI